LSGGTNQFGAGVIKVNTHYIIQNNVLTFWAEFQCEPGGYMRMNGNNMNLPVTSVVAGTWRIISSEGNLGIPPISIPLGVTGTIGAGASTFGTLTTGPAFFTNRLEAPVTLIITGSYGV